MKKGVLRSFEELKEGDVVSIVVFDDTTCPLAQNFVVGRDTLPRLSALVAAIEPRGGSNLRDGLDQGYAAVNRAYQPSYSNRVVVVTDAGATFSAQDEELAALSARNFDTRRVRLSAVGVGETVSDALLDRITESGRGASIFLSSEAEIDAVFGSRFPSLIETVATNVHFKLELPPALSLRAFYGEEASTRKARVQAIHFFSGTAQMYLANLKKNRALRPTDQVKLSIEYDDPESGAPQISEFSWRADELELATGEKSRFATRNLNKARMVATFGYQLRYMARTYQDLLGPPPASIWSTTEEEPSERLRTTRLAEAVRHCRRVKGRLDAFSAQLGGEAEASRLTGLWHKYCERYEAPFSSEELLGTDLTPRGEERLVRLDDGLLGREPRHNDFAPEFEEY
jgi:hypothetical protein